MAVFENCDIIEEGAEEEEEDEAVDDVGLRWFFPYDAEEFGDLQDVTLLFFVEEAFAALLSLLLALLPLLHRRLSSQFSFSALLLVLMLSLLSSSLEEPTKTNVVDGFVFLFFFCSFFDDVAVFENGHSGGNMPIRSL